MSVYPSYSLYFPLSPADADSTATAPSVSGSASPTPAVVAQTMDGTQILESSIPAITVVGTALVPEGTFVVCHLSLSSHTRFCTQQCFLPQQTNATQQEYNLMLHCGKACCQLSKRFSELAKVHKALKSVVPSLPPFPPKRRLEGAHMVSPVNVATRATELQKYYDELLRTPGVLASDTFYDALNMAAVIRAEADGPAAAVSAELTEAQRVRELFQQYGHLQLGDELRHPRKAAPTAASASAASASPAASPASVQRAARRECVPRSTVESDHDFYYSQRFHILAKKMQAVPRRGRDSDEGFSDDDGSDGDITVPIPALFFTHALQFFVRAAFWDSDRTVRESVDGRTWFSMVGPVPSVAVGRNPRSSDYFALINAAASVPLMFISIVEKKHLCNIWEAMTDGTVGANICAVSCLSATDGDKTRKVYRVTSSTESGARHDGLLFLPCCF